MLLELSAHANGQQKIKTKYSGTYELLWRQSEHGSGTVNLGAVEILSDQLKEATVATAN